MKIKTNKKEFSKKKKILFSLLTILLSVIIILVICEIILRVFPIPGIRYDVAKYDTLTGSGYYPNSTNFYRNDRGDFVKGKINKWGYYDKNYDKEKRNGFTRIGFFGDSYTQAIQVPLKETFHYLVGDSLKKYKVETMSFGISGFSTFQSYLTCNKWVDFFKLDIIVYVFCENDLGDQIKAINKSPNIPYPIIKNDQLTTDNSFREHREHRLKFYFKFFDYLTSHFLVFATLSERLQLLFKHGIKVSVTEEDRFMTNNQNKIYKTKHPPYLDQGDNPSIWPDSLRIIATNLERIILLKWEKEIENKQKDFIILYTPKDIETPTHEQDTWKPWLEKFCIENNIPFIDPTSNLLKMQKKGNDVFYDHYTKFGHKATANEFIKCWLIQEGFEKAEKIADF